MQASAPCRVSTGWHCAAKQPQPFTKEFITAPFVGKTGSAELAERDDDPTMLSQINVLTERVCTFVIRPIHYEVHQF